MKLFHRFRRRAVRDGGTGHVRVRALLTNRRILLATGGPEGKHKFVILMILDYTTPAPGGTGERVCGLQEEVRPAERLSDVCVLGRGRQPGRGARRRAALRIEVPFPEAGTSWGDPPEVKLFTKQAERYREAITRR